MRNIRYEQGFTLIELLIASTISLVVMVTIVTAFRTGIFGYRDIEDTLATQRGAQQILDRVRLDLKNAFAYSKGQSRFKGQEDNMVFLTLVDVFQDKAWRRELASVSYRWDGKRLLRLLKTGKSAVNEWATDLSEEAAVPNGKFAISYGTWNSDGNSLSFVDRWDAPQRLPVAVKIELTYSGVPFEQIVALPVTK